MKKVCVVVGGILFGTVLLVTAACGILWLSTFDYTGISVRNGSDTPLENVVVTVSDVPYAIGEVKPGFWQSTGMDSRHWRYDLHFVFDAGGKHFDYPARIHMFPFRACFISVSVDPQMKISYETSYF